MCYDFIGTGLQPGTGVYVNQTIGGYDDGSSYTNRYIYGLVESDGTFESTYSHFCGQYPSLTDVYLDGTNAAGNTITSNSVDVLPCPPPE